MNKQSQLVLSSPIGPISLLSDGGRLHSIDFGAGAEAKDFGDHCELLHEVGEQLNQYLRGERKQFDLNWQRDIWPAPTHWQQRAREAMLQIPYGETLSYAQLGRKCGGKRHSRAAGLACRSNLLPLLVPCHRVVASDGSLHGFGGGLANKQWLLNLERSQS